MGIIQKQAISGTIFSYLGVVLGFVSTGLLLPNIFNTAENGLLKLIVSYSLLFAQFGSLGFGNVVMRMFTYFRNKEKQHNGFFFLLLLILFLGFGVAVLTFYIAKPIIIAKSIENSALFLDYLYFLMPLVFFTLAFYLFDAYYTVLYNAVIGLVLKEFLQRLLILVAIGGYMFNWLNFNTFVAAYVLAMCIPTIVIFIALIKDGEVFIMPNFKFLSKDLIKTMTLVALFGFLASFSNIAIQQIDSVMISSFSGLEATGIYAITFYFGSLIKIPSRPIQKIASTLLADAWKNNDIQMVKDIYYKTSINQFIIACLLIIGLWANIHNVFQILPAEYEAGKYVLLFIALANVLDMSTGVNIAIISSSKYYKVFTYFMAIFLFLIISTNYIFIPIWGITGAAFASFLSTLISWLLRLVFVYRKFKMQPFNLSFLYVILISVVTLLIGYYLPALNFYIFDILVRSSIMTIIFMVSIYKLKVSTDINDKINQLFAIVLKRIKH